MGKEGRCDIEINDWEDPGRSGGSGDWPSLRSTNVPLMPSSGSNIWDCILSNEPGMQIRVWGEAMQIYLVHWRWKMVSGRGRNLPARKIKRATKTKGWTPQIRGPEFGQRCLFLSDRNSASFPGYCKTRGKRELRFCWYILYPAPDSKSLRPNQKFPH